MVTTKKPDNGEYAEPAGGTDITERLREVSEACTGCDVCQKECAFLRKYGKPKEIAGRYNPETKEDQGMPFECSLCGLCTAVCPFGADPARLFLEMRRETVRRTGGDYPEHAALRAYERRGTSRRYSYYGLPDGCDTVFFPGCTLSGTRPERVIESYRFLKEKIPSVGIVLDCCTKPSHDLGRQDHFSAMFDEMKDYLVGHGIKNVIVACPNCHKVFSSYAKDLTTTSIYEILVGSSTGKTMQATGAVTVHDPCAIRSEGGLQDSVRELLRNKGCALEEMPHSRGRTLCCGEGGTVGALAPDLAGNWSRLRRQEAAGRKVITYCAGCAGMLGRFVPTVHILDILWNTGVDAKGNTKVTKPPFTYWKRLRLKKWFREHIPAAATRERTFTGKEPPRKGAVIKFLIFLLFLAAVVAAVRVTGVSRYLEQQTLRTWIGSYGALAPIVYILVYTVSPALFLPGLPITVAGGILFGPLWGVVYAIIGATLGASVAFLVSRYLARQWVEERLKSPRWRRLDQAVEKHGWKVVAFTRLVPLFPFNLLNYAFGLTKIGFRQYVVATFFFMLPACIAFIVFSSSLLDLIRGKISQTFVIGLVLVILVSMLPFFYRRYNAKRGKDDPV